MKTVANRAILRVSGPEARDFLQGLVSNDMRKLDQGAVYAALLTPQGKYLFDFLLYPDGDDILIDVASDRAASLAQRLSMYKLRRKVEVAPTDLAVAWGEGDAPEGTFADPRDPALGWRQPVEAAGEAVDLADRFVANTVPQSGVELIPDDSYILEMGFERLNGVDFRKGCYVGQEVTARMKHKTELKKGLVPVAIEGEAAPGTPIMAGEKEAGRLGAVHGDKALAYLRFDRAKGKLRAGEATVIWDGTKP
ncbi:YgfZ/GcvT domain-containing protein [Paracoccaceae bacterium GXU_MW_L88]